MKKVLVVDDDPVAAELVRYSIQKGGYEVVHAATGKEAEEELKREDLDLVILDLVLPDRDGFELLSAIRAGQTTSSLPVLIITTLTGRSLQEKAAALGADGFLNKPFTPEALQDSVQSAISR